MKKTSFYDNQFDFWGWFGNIRMVLHVMRMSRKDITTEERKKEMKKMKEKYPSLGEQSRYWDNLY